MKKFKRSDPMSWQNRDGFTLLELMVVIVIIGILAGFVGINVIDKIEKAKITGTRAQIKTLHGAVKLYKIDTGEYPIELEDLVTMPPDVENWAKNGYLDGAQEIPHDNWHNEYQYDLAEGDDYPFYIFSYGADGQEGGEEESADLYNVDVYADSDGGDGF